MTTAQQAALEGPAVPLQDVERELNRQMKALQGPGESPVRRARMSNLVIYTAGMGQALEVDADIPDIVAVHPARVLLLIGDPDAAFRELTATVTVRPIRVDHEHYACAEQVTLRAGGPAVDRLPFAVRSLLIGDLPANLWWAAPQPPPLAGPLLYELGEHAQQVMYDSRGWPDPVRGVAATASWLEDIERPNHGGRWRVASDLNWRRLKYWRRLLTQSLDPAVAPGAAESVTEVLIEHGPHAVVEAWELASWGTQRLGWRLDGGRVDPGVEMAWWFEGPAGSSRLRIRRLDHGPADIRHVRLDCKLADRPAAMDLVVEEDNQRLAVRWEGGGASSIGGEDGPSSLAGHCRVSCSPSGAACPSGTGSPARGSAAPSSPAARSPGPARRT